MLSAAGSSETCGRACRLAGSGWSRRLRRRDPWCSSSTAPSGATSVPCAGPGAVDKVDEVDEVDAARRRIHAAAGPEALHVAVLEATPAAELVRLRTGAARLLNDEGFPAMEVAAHLLSLPRLDEGWMRGVLRDAAGRARRHDDRSEAAPYLRRLLTDESDERGRVRTGLELAGALAATDPEAALDTLRSLLDRTADARPRASVALQFGMTAQAVGRPALTVLSRARDTLRAALGPDGDEAGCDLYRRIESAVLSADCTRSPRPPPWRGSPPGPPRAAACSCGPG
ncbi:hypothetical protein ABT093_03095 [Kitasatospora sp. NPDC002551]|uniref:hypothetical protein n=1 Tax=Kitasatospora sp. NPDC002551 TaxID=3154539 RepID=UPI003318126D